MGQGLATPTRRPLVAELLDMQGVCELVGTDGPVHHSTIRRWIKQGMPAQRFNERWYFDVDDVCAWLDARVKSL